MDQVEIEEWLAENESRKREQFDAIQDAFAQIAAAPNRPTQLFMSQNTWEQLRHVTDYHHNRTIKQGRRKKRKRKRGY